MLKDKIKAAFTEQLVASSQVKEGGYGLVHNHKVQGITIAACKQIQGVYKTQKLFTKQMDELGFFMQWSEPANGYIVMEPETDWQRNQVEQNRKLAR